jgi:methionine-rich copper-binding protein CopC
MTAIIIQTQIHSNPRGFQNSLENKVENAVSSGAGGSNQPQDDQMTKARRSQLYRSTHAMAGAAAFLLFVGSAAAATMHVVQSWPSVQAIMDGDQTEFFVRFDGPVDHAGSVLSVMQGGHLVQLLHPRLNTQPNTLYSGVRRLASGAYTLHWATYSFKDHSLSQGTINFRVSGTKSG